MPHLSPYPSARGNARRRPDDDDEEEDGEEEEEAEAGMGEAATVGESGTAGMPRSESSRVRAPDGPAAIYLKQTSSMGWSSYSSRRSERNTQAQSSARAAAGLPTGADSMQLELLYGPTAKDSKPLEQTVHSSISSSTLGCAPSVAPAGPRARAFATLYGTGAVSGAGGTLIEPVPVGSTAQYATAPANAALIEGISDEVQRLIARRAGGYHESRGDLYQTEIRSQPKQMRSRRSEMPSLMDPPPMNTAPRRATHQKPSYGLSYMPYAAAAAHSRGRVGGGGDEALHDWKFARRDVEVKLKLR